MLYLHYADTDAGPTLCGIPLDADILGIARPQGRNARYDGDF